MSVKPSVSALLHVLNIKESEVDCKELENVALAFVAVMFLGRFRRFNALDRESINQDF